MGFTTEFLDEVKSRITLSTLIGRTVKLTKSGREFKGCCPFHNEKTASFTVNDEKGFWHCFGCGVHGDSIRWLTDQRGLSFDDAVRELADHAGIEVPAYNPRHQEKVDHLKIHRQIMAEAQEFFHNYLMSDLGGGARAYLNDRGISEGAILEFRLGFSPKNSDQLRSALKRYSEELLIEAGLLIRRDDGSLYPRFNRRIIIPIADARGRTIAFGGRIFGPGEPKYINSPETPLFSKGRVLFNLHRAAPAARSNDRLIQLEGYIDVISLWVAGIVETVAPMGTALTENQISQMWKIDPAPVICMDGDNAGRKAAWRAVLTAMPGVQSDRTLKFASMPDGQDPDDVVTKGGAAAFNELLESKVPLHEFIWAHTHSKLNGSSPEDRAEFKRTIFEVIDPISDQLLKAEYRELYQQRWSTAGVPVGDRRDSVRRSPFKPLVAATPAPKTSQARLMQLILIHTILVNRELAREFVEEIGSFQFDHTFGDIKSGLINWLVDGEVKPLQDQPALAREIEFMGRRWSIPFIVKNTGSAKIELSKFIQLLKRK